MYIYITYTHTRSACTRWMDVIRQRREGSNKVENKTSVCRPSSYVNPAGARRCAERCTADHILTLYDSTSLVLLDVMGWHSIYYYSGRKQVYSVHWLWLLFGVQVCTGCISRRVPQDGGRNDSHPQSVISASHLFVQTFAAGVRLIVVPFFFSQEGSDLQG